MSPRYDTSKWEQVLKDLGEEVESGGDRLPGFDEVSKYAKIVSEFRARNGESPTVQGGVNKAADYTYYALYLAMSLWSNKYTSEAGGGLFRTTAAKLSLAASLLREVEEMLR